MNYFFNIFNFFVFSQFVRWEQLLMISWPGKTWKPAWAQEPNCNLLPPGSASNLSLEGEFRQTAREALTYQQNWEVEELMFDHIEKFGLVDKSIPAYITENPSKDALDKTKIMQSANYANCDQTDFMNWNDQTKPE